MKAKKLKNRLQGGFHQSECTLNLQGVMGSLAAHHKDCIIGEQWSTSHGTRSNSVYLIDETSPTTTNSAETLRVVAIVLACC